jgi:Rrf2 family protein
MAKAPDRLHSVAEMVELEGIPKAYLSAILNILVRYGVISSRRGPSGGYVLARSPSEISLARVVEVLEGPLFPVVCLGAGSEPCLDCNADCAARWALGSASRAAWQALESLHVSDLTHCPKTENGAQKCLPVYVENRARSFAAPVDLTNQPIPKP